MYAGKYVDNPRPSVTREIAVNDGTVRHLVMDELVVVLNDAADLLVRVSVKHLSHRGSLRKCVRVTTVAYGPVGFHCTIFHSYDGNGGMLSPSNFSPTSFNELFPRETGQDSKEQASAQAA